MEVKLTVSGEHGTRGTGAKIEDGKIHIVVGEKFLKNFVNNKTVEFIIPDFLVRNIKKV